MWPKIKSFFLQNKTAGQTVAKNTFWSAVSNVGGRLLRAAVVIYAARVLGTEGWGAFSYALALVGFLTFFVSTVGGIARRDMARVAEGRSRAEILGTIFWLTAVLLAAGVLIVVFIAPPFASIPAARALLPIVALVLVFDTLRQFGFSVIQGLEKMEVETALFLLTNLAITVFGFAFLYASRTPAAFTWSYAAGTAVGMVATFLWLRKIFIQQNISGWFFSFSRKLVGYLARSVWPFAISGILGMFMLNADILILGWLRSAEEVGLYSAANRIIQLLYILPTILTVSIFPVFSRLAGKDNAKMGMLTERSISLLLLAAMPMAAGGVILGREIMVFTFGGSYAAGAGAFRILMATMVIDFSAVLLSYVMFAYDQQKNLVVYSALGAGANIILDMLLIPRFGMAGSAWATLAAQFLSNAYLWRATRKINYFQILPRLKRIFAATAIMSAATVAMSFLGWHVLIIVGISALIYFALLYRLKEPVLKEIKGLLRSHFSEAEA